MRNRKISIPSPFCFSTFFSVQVSDINYGGHVGNERHLLFAQETRIRFLQTIGCSEVHFGPFGLAVTEAHVEYFHELFHGNDIKVFLAIDTPSRASFDCFYSIKLMKNNEEIEVAAIKTSMVCFDYNARKVRSIPEDLKAILAKCAEGKS